MLGNNLIISVDGTAIAASKSCNIDVECSTIETSSPMTGSFRTYLVGRKGWKVTVSTLVSNNKNFLLTPGTSVTLSFAVRNDNTDVLTGDAICTHCKVTATRFNLVQGTFEFLGNGELQ